ncbi:hypothetical protein FACS189419_06300 [Planctomycetales bacterium]|nr:hypothetical protein FACS189419_06300 [Planctomycetales bacterium]
MTTIEHALFGTDLVLAAGLNRRFGWQLAALAGACVWVVVAVIASYSHLLADIIVSGTATLADWDVKIFFPFSDKGIVYPLVPWGDVGNTVILLLGMFTMLRWNNRVRTTAVITILSVIAYSTTRSMV